MLLNPPSKRPKKIVAPLSWQILHKAHELLLRNLFENLPLHKVDCV